MAGGATERRGGIIEGINVTPLVDIVLVLLIIFIVTAKIVVAPAVPLDLPKAAQSEDLQTIFSIAIRAYRSRWLSEAIESVLAQTYDDLELIVYDDAGEIGRAHV